MRNSVHTAACLGMAALVTACVTAPQPADRSEARRTIPPLFSEMVAIRSSEATHALKAPAYQVQGLARNSENPINTLDTSRGREPAVGGGYAKLTSFLVIAPRGTAGSESDKGEVHKAGIGGTYTRLMVRAELEADGQLGVHGDPVSPPGGKPLKYEPRSWPMRALWGEESATNFSLLFKVDTHEQIASLVTIGRQSNTKGEKWGRTVSHSDLSFPYFLVRNDGTSSAPKLAFRVKSDNTYQSQGFAAALSVALQVADKLVNEPIVVNSLASTSSRAKAKAADSAISQLFGTSIVEEHTTDRDLSGTVAPHTFSMGAAGVTVRLLLPAQEGDYAGALIPVGTWHVGFDDPKPSIFSPIRICTPMAAVATNYCATDLAMARARVTTSLAASEVLAFLLTPPPGAPITVETFLRTRPYVQSSMPLFASTDAGTQLRAYDSLCQNVVNDIVKLGLNDFDGRAVLWAAMKGMPDVVMASSVPATSSCRTLLNGFPA